MSRLCYLTRNYRNVDTSGNKAKTDNEDTLELMGAVNLGLKRTYYTSKVLTFFLDLSGVIKYLFSIRKGDVVLLQYPVKKYFSFLCNYAHLRKAKTVALIHDLGSFRRKKLTVEKEISRLMHADYVIASNSIMRDWLVSNGYSNPTGQLGLFDYRSKSAAQLHNKTNDKHRLVYAGALAMRKNSFLLQMAECKLSYELHIYGNRSGLSSMKDNDNIIFHSFTPADEFIENVEGDFGLVWDGDSLDNCTGNFGEYLRFNSPHKVSFYIRAGLPIIIWKHAAVASIIEKEDIGICIESLEELDEKLSSITPTRMAELRNNVMRVSDRLRNGDFLRTAVTKAIEAL